MQIKNLQDQLISVDGIILKDGKLSGLFEKLTISDTKDVEDGHLPNNLDGETHADDSSGEIDEGQLTPKGPIRTKDCSSRDLPYEQRTSNKNLMNGGGVFENRYCVPKLQHGTIPVPVLKFQSQLAAKNVIPTEAFQPYQQFVGQTSTGMDVSSTSVVPLAELLEQTRPSPLPISRTPMRVDSPLSSDSGINSPSSSPNRGAWQAQSVPGYPYYPTTLPVSEPQAVGSPCSPESGYSPAGSLESQSWPYDQQSREGFYETTGLTEATENISSTSHDWALLNSFGYPNSNGPNIESDWYQNHRYSYLPETAAHHNHLTAIYGGPASHPSECPSNIPPDSERSCGTQASQISAGQWSWDPAILEEIVRELGEDLNCDLESANDSQSESLESRCSPASSQSVPADPQPTPKIKNNRPKIKPPRPDRTSQHKRKSTKPVPLDSAKPKICYMIDHKKESTKTIWMGVSLMEKFTQKNSEGQTCLMEVLLGEKLSIERAYFIVLRMKKIGNLLSSKDIHGQNALYLAAIRHPQIPELASFIAESYTSNFELDVNEGYFEEENSLIHCLVEKGESHREVLCDLLDLKVEDKRLFNINCRNTKGDTPIHLALRNLSKSSYPFDLSMVDILLKRGASISIQNLDGDTPLHIAAKTACDEKVFRKLFERLLLPPEENQNAMNIQDNEGNTPLHLVAYNINPSCNVEKMKKVVKVFLDEKHTRIDIQNKKQFTPIGSIHQACVKEFHDLFYSKK